VVAGVDREVLGGKCVSEVGPTLAQVPEADLPCRPKTMLAGRLFHAP
jgi:hypothetical protein